MTLEIIVVVLANIFIFTQLDPKLGFVLTGFMFTFYLLSLYMTRKASDQEYIVNKAEEGSFDELMGKNGLFAKMWQEQKL